MQAYWAELLLDLKQAAHV